MRIERMKETVRTCNCIIEVRIIELHFIIYRLFSHLGSSNLIREEDLIWRNLIHNFCNETWMNGIL